MKLRGTIKTKYMRMKFENPNKLTLFPERPLSKPYNNLVIRPFFSHRLTSSEFLTKKYHTKYKRYNFLIHLEMQPSIIIFRKYPQTLFITKLYIQTPRKRFKLVLKSGESWRFWMEMLSDEVFVP